MDSKVVMTNKIGGMWHPDSKPADDKDYNRCADRAMKWQSGSTRQWKIQTVLGSSLRLLKPSPRA